MLPELGPCRADCHPHSCPHVGSKIEELDLSGLEKGALECIIFRLQRRIAAERMLFDQTTDTAEEADHLTLVVEEFAKKSCLNRVCLKAQGMISTRGSGG